LLRGTLIALAVTLGLGGCHAKEQDHRVADAATPISGGTLIYATDREPLCLDPHSLGDMPQAFLAQQFLDSLVSMDEQGRIGPWLAKSWDISPDGLVYTFHLREDVHFTDGTPFTAEAVKANLDHMIDPRTQGSTDKNYLQAQYLRTDILDLHTAAVHLSKPYAAFLEVLAQGFLGFESPAALKRPERDNCESPVGSGPFKVTRWDRQNQVVLERNPDYAWAPPTAKHQGPAYLDKILWKFIPVASVRFGSLESGAVDVIDGLPPESHAPARRNPDITLVLRDRPGNPTHGNFNVTRPPFDDVRVREAFVRAANVEGALKSVFFGEFPRAGGPLSSGTPFYSPEFEHAEDYDPARATRLLDEAGWTQRDGEGYRIKNGHRLTVFIPLPDFLSEAERALWEQVQASVKKVGFAVELEPMSQAELLTRYYPAWDYDVVVGYWNTNTPDVLRFVFGSAFIKPSGPYHSNGSGFSDPALDGLLEQALETQDPAVRRQLYSRAQGLISQQYLQLTTYPQSTRLAIYKSAHGVRVEPSLTITYLYDAWVTK
jgi:peptide/nickel transport system substrate-binding protein